jgi:hypothetical protein
VARGNHHWGRILLVLALIVIVLLIAADRIGVVIAQKEVAKQAQAQLASEDITDSGTPDVTIHGFPFLTQVASGNYGKITIDIPNPTSKGIQLEHLDVVATDVNAPTSAVLSGDGQIKADRVSGTAQLDWQTFQQMVDLSGLKQYGVDPTSLRINSAGPGKVSISAPAKILGQSFTALATGSIAVANNVLHVKIDNISTADSTLPALVQQQLQQLRNQLTFDVRIPELPYHLVLDSVSTNAAGVLISASATNVVLGS